MPIDSAEEALTLLRAQGVMALAALPPLPSLAEEVAGEPVRGSWWAHAKGGDIYRIANELEEHPEVLVAKLVAGKVTFVHARLWPALYRVVTDPGWRSAAVAAASPAAGRLLADAASSPLRFDTYLAEVPAAERAAMGKAKDEVDKGMLVRAAQVHTSSGRHATVLSSWESWAAPEVVTAAAGIELEQARQQIAEAVAGCATPLAARPSPRAPATRTS
jgi:hypothetical protein